MNKTNVQLSETFRDSMYKINLQGRSIMRVLFYEMEPLGFNPYSTNHLMDLLRNNHSPN